MELMLDICFVLLFMAFVGVLAWAGYNDVRRARIQATTSLFMAWCQYRTLEPENKYETFDEFVKKVKAAEKFVTKINK